ncbi:MEDS domain-containing protein [Candidatus Sumerlaeota bacterium]|nr:MEDS domain-containing protein [Candidatus Sumerlaeota bacterium]
MEKTKRKTGIETIGDMPWSAHLCFFYQTQKDLIEILVPYFKAGLENNEFCMWVASEPLSAKDAKRALKKAVRNLDDCIATGQIEILDHSEWYTQSGKFDADRVLQGWVEKEKQALSRGFDGLRLSGNTSWLEKEEWRAAADYEATTDDVIGAHRMLAICSYPLDRCGVTEVIDVVSNHEIALIRRQGKWETIQSARRKRAENALRESEERLWLAQINADVGVWDWFPRTQKLSWSPELEGLYGCAPGTIKTYEDWRERVHPEDIVEAETERDKAIAERRPFNLEFRILLRDTGAIRWIAALGNAIYDDNGDVVRVSGINIDITERKRMEEALRESQAKFQELFDEAPVGYHELDTEGRIVRVNSTELEMLGYTTAEMLNCPVWNFVVEKQASRDALRAKLAGALPPGMGLGRTGGMVRRRRFTVGVRQRRVSQDLASLCLGASSRRPRAGRCRH